MRYFYRTKENNEILDYTSFSDTDNVPAFILEQYTETDREIVQVTNGKLMFADEVDEDEEAAARLAQAKAAKIVELKQKRDSEEVTVIEYAGNVFDYDDKARERMRIAREALQDSGVEGASIVWTTADNQRVTLIVADFAGINGAAAYRSNALHIKYNELKEAVNACTTVEEVQAICWTEGYE